jgi:hypothetical protein
MLACTPCIGTLNASRPTYATGWPASGGAVHFGSAAAGGTIRPSFCCARNRSPAPSVQRSTVDAETRTPAKRRSRSSAASTKGNSVPAKQTSGSSPGLISSVNPSASS